MNRVGMKMFKSLFGIGVAISLAVPQAAFSEASQPKVLSYYIMIQESLAADSLEGAKSGASQLAKSAEASKVGGRAEIIASAKSMGQASTIKEARKHFKQLSKVVVVWVEKSKPEGVQVSYCAMAGARWVQKQGEIRNPYYGKEMLTCGEKVSG
jgi:hypothetical protein